MSIRTRYEQELHAMSDKLFLMLRKVESTIETSVSALVSRDKATMRAVVDGDVQINALEREIEQDCLKILLMEHPVAGDFREVSAALKMITDLERIGDQARDICEIGLQFGDEKYIKKLEHIPRMAAVATEMVKDSVHSYVNGDVALAKSLDAYDDKVDEMFETVKNELIDLIKKDSDNAEQAILFMMIAKYIERIADHAVNIGEWAEYSVTGVRETN